MNDYANTSTEDLKRIPGLFRRWELPDVLEAHRSYHIEQAGFDSEGTPLTRTLRRFRFETHSERYGLSGRQTPDREPVGRPVAFEFAQPAKVATSKTGPAYFRVGKRRVLKNAVDVESDDVRRHVETGSLVLGSGVGRHG